MFLSAETSFRLLINDQRLIWGPLREVPPYFYYEQIDLRPHLRIGTNRLRILCHHQGVDSQAYAKGTAALLVGGMVETPFGPADLSDASLWRGRRLPQYRREVHRLGICLGFAEHHDFRLEPGPFRPVRTVARHPWDERPTALPRDLPPIAGEKVISEVSTVRNDQGWLIDFGQEVYGFVEMDFRTDSPLDAMEIAYAEVLDSGAVDPRRHPAVDYRDLISSPIGEHAWRSYEKRAFRYLQIDQPIELRKVTVTEQSQTRLIRKSVEPRPDRYLASQVLDVSARTIEVCIDDMIMDCPWRERAQYLDLLFFIDSLFALHDGMLPARRFLRQYARGAGRDGQLRMCYPSPKSTTVIVDYSLGFAHLLRRYAELSGDWSTAIEFLPLARQAVERWSPYDEEHLLTNPPGWVFLDNTNELSRGPRSAALNAVYAGAHTALAILHGKASDTDAANHCRAKFRSIREAFRRCFLLRDRLLDSDASPDFEAQYHWNYHYPADGGPEPDSNQGAPFFFSVELAKKNCEAQILDCKAQSRIRVWLDGQLVCPGAEPPGWSRNAIFDSESPNRVHLPEGISRHQLILEVHPWRADWEFWLSSQADLEFGGATVWMATEGGTDLPNPGTINVKKSSLRRWTPPWLSQATVGYSAYHGMLEENEARQLLQSALPTIYPTPWRKRITPFFATITDDPALIKNRVHPTWVPASAAHFVAALMRYGLKQEGLDYLDMIYGGTIAHGATTWWEEWGNRSSNCHAWGAFGAHWYTADAHRDIQSTAAR